MPLDLRIMSMIAYYSIHSPGPGPVDLAKKTQNDIDIRKVLMLVHLFPKYFEINAETVKYKWYTCTLKE